MIYKQHNQNLKSHSDHASGFGLAHGRRTCARFYLGSCAGIKLCRILCRVLHVFHHYTRHAFYPAARDRGAAIPPAVAAPTRLEVSHDALFSLFLCHGQNHANDCDDTYAQRQLHCNFGAFAGHYGDLMIVLVLML